MKDLDARVLTAIREQVLAPGVIDYIVDRVIATIEERRKAGDVAAKRDRLAAIGPEIENLVAVAAKLDGLEEITAKLAALKRERTELTAAVRAAALDRVDPAVVRAEVVAELEQLGSALQQAPETGRHALRGLLRGQRLRVRPDAKRGFAVRGTAWINVGGGAPDPGSRGLVRSGGLIRPGPDFLDFLMAA